MERNKRCFVIENLLDFLKNIDPSIVLGLPIVLITENSDEISHTDIRNLRLVDIISKNDITEEAILRTQLLLQSTLNANLISFFDNFNKDSFFESLFGKLEEAVSIANQSNMTPYAVIVYYSHKVKDLLI